MKVIIANKKDYIDFYYNKIDKMQTFELKEDSKNYVIHRVKLGNEINDVSLMDSCINNLLDKQCEKNKFITLQEIIEMNDLLIELDKEQSQIINAYSEVKRYSIKDLEEVKNLIKNINDYRIVEAYNPNELGQLICKKLPQYHINIDVIPYVDFEKLGHTFLWDANIKEDFCSYGLLVNTREMLDNELVKAKVTKDKVFEIEIVNKKEYEEASIYSSVIMYLPSTNEIMKEKLNKINLDYDNLSIQDTHILKCNLLNFYNPYLVNKFNQLMKNEIEKFSNQYGYTTPLQEIEKLGEQIKKFDNSMMIKFLSLADVKENKITNINDLAEIASNIKKYELIPDIQNYEQLGKYLVKETGHFEDVYILDDYINYEQLAKEYTKKGYTYNGDFTEFGYLIKNKNLENENENEEEF